VCGADLPTLALETPGIEPELDRDIGVLLSNNQRQHRTLHIENQTLGLLGFERAQHRQTLRPIVDGARSKDPRPFGLQ